MIKSPLRYPGGKSRAVKLISSLIPDFGEYREPFLGGGSLFVYLKQAFPNKSFWVNDLCNELYLFWHFVQKDLDGLIKQIVKWKKNFLQGKDLYNFLNANMQNFSDLEKAAAFFIYNRITFSGTTLSGGFSNGAFEKRFTQSSIERLQLLKQISNNFKITNDDYEMMLKQDGQDVFIFLDPPYFSAAKSALYGKNGKLHKTFDHERFAKAMQKCPHKWLITYDDSEYIKELFSFANIFSWNLTYGMRNVAASSNQNGKELFISNYLERLPQQDNFDFNYNDYQYRNVV